MSFSSKISDFWSNLDIKIENLRKILKFLIKKLRIWVKIEHQFLIFSSFSTYFKPVTWGRLGCRFRFEKQKIQVQVTGLGLIFLTGWAKPQVEIGLRRLQVQTLSKTDAQSTGPMVQKTLTKTTIWQKEAKTWPKLNILIQITEVIDLPQFGKLPPLLKTLKLMIG